MISEEVSKKIRRLQIISTRAVEEVLAGHYHSVFKGQGIEFDEVKEYQPGDDVRSIDWNVTARMGHPFIKRYVEERELTILLLVDLSASGDFGSDKKTKKEIAAELSALIGFSAIKNNDKVGLITFTDQVEQYIPPAKGSTHILRLISAVLAGDAKGEGTSLNAPLSFLGNVIHRKAVVFLISDFFDTGYQHSLRVVAKKHDLINVIVRDRLESMLPDGGLLVVEGSEGGGRKVVDLSNSRVRKSFISKRVAEDEELFKELRRAGSDLIQVQSDEDYVADLVKFFRLREKRG